MQIIQGSSQQPVVEKLLVEVFEEYSDKEGILYTGFPIIGTSQGAFPLDATFLSEEYGVVIFKLIAGTDSEKVRNYCDEQDEIYNKVEGYLKSFKDLTARRLLKVPVTIVTFAPAINNITPAENYLIFNQNNISELFEHLDQNVKNGFNSEDFLRTKSVLQNIKSIGEHRDKRDIKSSDSKGAKIEYIRNNIATLDAEQSRAVVEAVNGVQRIRGLAGSGKTIIIALKAAYLHAKNPDWKIAVTFNTRALKNQFKELITRFYLSQTQDLPNWKNLFILNAWGRPIGGEEDGLYHQFISAQKDGIYYDYSSAKKKFGFEPFDNVCEEAILHMEREVPIYDAILIDEAQDFSKYFFQICYHLTKSIEGTGKKRIVYAYDELQSLSGRSLPSPEELFGQDKDTNLPRVRIKYNDDREDIVLERCYRNPRPILTAAHALGFGVYRQFDERTGTGLVQMFEDADLWKEVGYINKLSRVGDIPLGQRVKLSRTDETSPLFLENHSSFEDLISFTTFDTSEQQSKWIADEIIKNIKDDDLIARDIIVINPDPIKTKNEVRGVRAELFKQGILTQVAGEANPNVFFTDDSTITFTGIYRAKGNEASMVYVMNAQDCYDSASELQTVRNRLFTAMTRSKGWLRVTGVGTKMTLLKEEFENVREKSFDLDFIYPTMKQLKVIQTINRDKTDFEQQEIEKTQRSLSQVLDSLKNGAISGYDIDLSVEDREILAQILNRK